MPQTVKCVQANEPKGKLVPGTIERRDLRDKDVAIDIKAAGFCFSDCHTRDEDWGPTKFPLVPGHEIVGRVTESRDPRFKVGQLVGVGCMVDSCASCSQCKNSEEQFCEKRATMTYNSTDRVDGSPTYGGYSEKIVVKGDFVINIPENLSPEGAAPLLCAGITTYAPLARFGAGPGKKVLVAGLGGLGHVAIKYASAMGAEVTLSTRSASKAKDAKELGAHHILVTSEPEQWKAATGTFDIIIDTISADHDLSAYMSLLKPYGAMALLGHIGNTTLHTAPLVMGNRILAGSLIGGIKETQEALDAAGKYGVEATVEKVSFKDVNEVWDRLYKSDCRYRFVFDPSTL